MRKINYLFLLFIMSCLLHAVKSQSRMVFNNDCYMVIDNSAFVVVDNSNANAITTLGTGGNILSEDELDVVRWEIDNATGNYIVPWTTASGFKIPLAMNVTTAGSAGGRVDFSTYETATDLNTPYPSAVVNMNFNAINKSLFVLDRFWHVDASSFGTWPSGSMVFNYDPTANEMAGTNTIIETNLQAQRFNTTLGHWESYIILGTNDAGNDRVTAIPFSSTDFFQDWILVDNTNPLPIELGSFDAKCNGDDVKISWTTLTEINNAFFVVEKSYDALSFFELETVSGAGNSNVLQNYSVTDDSPSRGVAYYRLKQVDFDGTTEYHTIISSNCSSNGFEANSFIMNNNELNFNITTGSTERITINFYDYKGRIISTKMQNIQKGNNSIRLNKLNLSRGIYMLSIVGETNFFATKLLNINK